MPWCPNCKAECGEGASMCDKCNTELVEKLESSKDSPTNNCSDVYLMSVPDVVYADVIESLLAAYGIPINKKYRYIGDDAKAIFGFTNLEMDLYVPGATYQDAIGIIEGQYEDINSEFEDLNMTDYDEEFNE